eukprot:scaffold104046_cov63-Phaeocystis_antarctica.AAC.1
MFSSASDLETELKIKYKCPTAPTLHAYISLPTTRPSANPSHDSPAPPFAGRPSRCPTSRRAQRRSRLDGACRLFEH